MLQDKKIGFIGGGNMAEAIIRGLLFGGVSPAAITVSEPAPDRRDSLQKSHGIGVVVDNAEAVAASDILILAVKPQAAEAVFKGIAGKASAGKLFISIMAGVTTRTLEEALGNGARVVRVMPNTPALVLEAASALSGGKNAGKDDIETARRLFDLIGKTYVLEEKLMDVVTGLSGSGPAYVFMFIEALSDAGVKNGLSRDIATHLAAQTVLGAARMVMETGEHPALLREKVTSPAGTTIAGLHVLETGGLRGTVINAVDAATARSRELGKG